MNDMNENTLAYESYITLKESLNLEVPSPNEEESSPSTDNNLGELSTSTERTIEFHPGCYFPLDRELSQNSFLNIPNERGILSNNFIPYGAPQIMNITLDLGNSGYFMTGTKITLQLETDIPDNVEVHPIVLKKDKRKRNRGNVEGCNHLVVFAVTRNRDYSLNYLTVTVKKGKVSTVGPTFELFFEKGDKRTIACNRIIVCILSPEGEMLHIGETWVKKVLMKKSGSVKHSNQDEVDHNIQYYVYIFIQLI